MSGTVVDSQGQLWALLRAGGAMLSRHDIGAKCLVYFQSIFVIWDYQLVLLIVLLTHGSHV